MTFQRARTWAAVTGGIALLGAWGVLADGPAGSQLPAADDAQVASARERAQTMHSIYAATLEAMHDHYFHGERAIVPARALEDVFSEIARESKVEARWISVNTRAMSLHHEPKSEFEKLAAAALAKGQKEFELVEKDYYQRAGVIPLADGCVACHTNFFGSPPKTPRVAGLVIRVPLARD